MLWQFVVFGHNEHEIPKARGLAKDLGMDFRVKLSWDEDISPVRDGDLVREAVGAASREEYRRRYDVPYLQSICHQLWDQPQINWDGKILGCCRNFWGDFAKENAFRDGLLASVNSEKMSYAREMLLGRKGAREDIPCTTCNIYLDMKAKSKWLERNVPTLPQRALHFAARVPGLRRLRSWIRSLRRHRARVRDEASAFALRDGHNSSESRIDAG